MQEDQFLNNQSKPQKNSLARVISIKNKIPSPNRLLPKQYQQSKRSKHYYSDFNSDINCQSSQLQQLYLENNLNETSIKEKLTIYVTKLYHQNQQTQNSLKTFFLHKLDQIIFLSLTAMQNIKNDSKQIKQINKDKFAQFLLKYLQRTNFPFLKLDLINKSLSNNFLQKFGLELSSQDLYFEENFQSSNILIAKSLKQFKNTYFISSRFDYNTFSYGQWFYFKVCRRKELYYNQNKEQYYKFVICNMTKRSCMLGKSMKISVCRNNSWQKQGEFINYYKSPFKRQQKHSQNQYFYILQFTLKIKPGQQLYIAYNQPYTYSRLSKLINQIGRYFFKNQDQFYSKKIIFKKSIVCQTYLKNQIECLSFTKKNFKQSQQKKIIFIFARAHPIQTAGSFVVQGILKDIFNLKKKEVTTFKQNQEIDQRSFSIQSLLQKFIIKIIPMLNPDGVILGNSRCNFYGFDLNRQWKNPKIQFSKEVYYIKKFILKYEGRIQMILDFHGHSKKKNVFAYGLHDLKNPFSTRQFPYLLSKLSPIDFNFEECRFTKTLKNCETKDKQIQVKQGTARIALWKKLKIKNIFTIQNSYCSSIYRKHHYNSNIYNEIGKDILNAIAIFFIQFDSQKVKKNKKQQKTTISIKLDVNIQARKQSQSQLNKVTQLKENIKKIKNSFMTDLKSKKQNITIGLQSITSSQSQQEIRFENSQSLIQQMKQDKKLKQKIGDNNKKKYQHTQQKVIKNIKSTYFVNQKEKKQLSEEKSVPYWNNFSLSQQGSIEKQKPLHKIQQSLNIKLNKVKKRRLASQMQKNYKQTQQNIQSRIKTLSIIEIGWNNQEPESTMKTSRALSSQKLKKITNYLQRFQVIKTEPKKEQRQIVQNLSMLKELKQKQFKFMQKSKFVQKSQMQRNSKYENSNKKKIQRLKQVKQKINKTLFPNLSK